MTGNQTQTSAPRAPHRGYQGARRAKGAKGASRHPRGEGPGRKSAGRRTAHKQGGGRHCAGQPGLAHYASSTRPGSGFAVSHHLRPSRSTRKAAVHLAAALSSLAATTTLVAAGWYALVGVAAITQMIRP